MSIRNGAGLSQAANKTVEEAPEVKRNRKITLQAEIKQITEKIVYRTCGQTGKLPAS